MNTLKDFFLNFLDLFKCSKCGDWGTVIENEEIKECDACSHRK